MQDRELEDLALDLKELLFLLREARSRKELLPVAERHINRLTKTLEEIRNRLNGVEEAAPQEEVYIPDAGLTLNDSFRLSREQLHDGKDD
jgi:hypothetical protein